MVMLLLSFVGCKKTLVEPSYSNENTPMSISVDRPGTYTFKNLHNKNVYFAILNTSRSSTAMHKRLYSKNSPNNIISWNKLGLTSSSASNNVEVNYSTFNASETSSAEDSDNIPIVQFISKEEDEAIQKEETKDYDPSSPRSGIPLATAFNCTPPRDKVDALRAQRDEWIAEEKDKEEKPDGEDDIVDNGVSSNLIDLTGSSNEKDKIKSFWVNSSTASDPGYRDDAPDYYGSEMFKEIEAKCVALTDHCAIYVATEQENILYGSNEITFAMIQARALRFANYFEQIYQLETKLFGEPFRMSMAPGKNEVEILIYDIDANNTAGGVVGFFWGKDYFTEEAQPYSNETEMFYLDSYYVRDYEKIAYSTLIHEFQHMINFNQKIILGGMYSVETWYNEMMSMIAEDMIYPVITPDDDEGWVMNVRIPEFLKWFRRGSVTHWLDTDTISYSFLAAFGGYLTRNFGGARLVRELSTNGYQGVSSIANAIETLYPKRYQNSSAVFTDLFLRFPEVMFYTNNNKLKSSFSFETPVSGIYTNYMGSDYALRDFKLWPFSEISGNSLKEHKPTFINPAKDTNTQYRIRIMSFMIFEIDDLKNVTGDLEINFSELAGGGIRYQIYVVSPPE